MGSSYFRFFIKAEVLSANYFLYKGKTYYNKKAKRVMKKNKVYRDYFNMLKEKIDHAVGKAPYERDKKKKVLLDIISIRPRKYDGANFSTGCKPILDVLKNLNWFYDDTPNYIHDNYIQLTTKDKSLHGVWIIMEVVDRLPDQKYSIEDILSWKGNKEPTGFIED